VSPQHGSDKSTAESHVDALAANWTMRRQRGASLARAGTRGRGQRGHGDDTAGGGGCASTWPHGITMITATTQKTKWETHTPPWVATC